MKLQYLGRGYIEGYDDLEWYVNLGDGDSNYRTGKSDSILRNFKYILYTTDEYAIVKLHKEVLPHTDLINLMDSEYRGDDYYICFNDDETFGLILLLMTEE
jgi:hypothetical protein